MGFLRRLFGPKKKPAADPTPNRHRNWSLIRSDKNRLPIPNAAASYGGSDANKHAIAVATATAAVAEAALAAAHAAAEVVRLTSGRGARKAAASPQARGRLAPVSVVEWAAVTIQSAFRGYLARRALRALKALVKLQALVRGYIVRKQMSDMLRRMQTLVRLQTRARVSRSHTSISTTNSSLLQNPRSVSNTTYRDGIDVSRPKLGSNWLEHWMEDNTTWDSPSYTQPRSKQDDDRSTKILEVDTWKPSKESRQIHGQMHHHHHVFDSDSPSGYSSKATNPAPSLSSEEPVTVRSVRGEKVRSGHNSPQVVTSAPAKRPGSSSGLRRSSPFAPARSECSWSFYNGYSSHPNFMANTESSRAKVRSQSTPRQREFDSAKTKRALQVSWDGGSFMNQDRRNRSPNLK